MYQARRGGTKAAAGQTNIPVQLSVRDFDMPAPPPAALAAEAAKNSFSEVFVKEQLNLLNIWNF